MNASTSHLHRLRVLDLPPGPEHPCPYLDGRGARSRAFLAERLPEGVYGVLLDDGWRRSGQMIYKPACRNCRQCVPVRIPVRMFQPARWQKRLLRRNRDLDAEVRIPEPTREKFDLFLQYQRERHGGQMCQTWREFIEFLYESPVRTLEVLFHLDRRLVAVALIDLDLDALSSVYTYFDPELARRSLGSWTILWLIDYARRRKIPYYYLGYYIAECRKMNYKTRFQPCELADGHGGWRKIESVKEREILAIHGRSACGGIEAIR